MKEWYDKETEILEKIAPAYRKKYAAARSEEAGYQELGAGYLLYRCLGVHKDEQLLYNPYGKPSIKDSAIEFNLSHSRNYVVLAVSKEPVGVDIEHAEQIPLVALRRVLSPSEWKCLQEMDYKKKELFVEYGIRWTEVEAILKGEGMGFFIDPARQPEYKEGWFCESRKYEEDFVITCAGKTPFALEIQEIHRI